MTVSRIAAAIAAMLTALLLQASLIGPLTFPVPVSLPVLLVIVTAVYAGPGTGLGLGFSTGLLADLGSDNPAGVQALTYLAAGLAAGLLGSLALRRRSQTRSVAALAGMLGAATCLSTGLMLSLLDSHGATPLTTIRMLIPVGFTEAILALGLAPLVRAGLRAQGVRAPKPAPSVLARVPDVLG